MNTSLRTDIVALLIKYLENQCSAAELEQVKQILSEGGYDAEWSAALARVETEPHSPTGQGISTERQQQLYRRIDNSLNKRTKTSFLIGYRRIWTAAAASILLFVAGWWLFREIGKPAPLQLSETSTATGQKKFITLADGTKVWLNNNSKISYPALFKGDSRDVYLDGEAFFDVAHNPQLPFRIHLAALNVQVYGTSFDIRSYRNDPAIAVAVATGKVGVTTPGQPHEAGQMLLPGDLLAYDRKQGTFEKSSIAIGDVNAWKEDRLVFREATLENISHVLERTYGVSIHFKDASLRAKRITLEEQHESLKNVLEIIHLTAGIHYRLSGNDVWIE